MHVKTTYDRHRDLLEFLEILMTPTSSSV
jgi:hypothetical protein